MLFVSLIKLQFDIFIWIYQISAIDFFFFSTLRSVISLNYQQALRVYLIFENQLVYSACNFWSTNCNSNISHLVVGLLPWNKMCYFHVIPHHSVEYIYYSTLKCGIIVLFHTKALNNKYIPHYSVK